LRPVRDRVRVQPSDVEGCRSKRARPPFSKIPNPKEASITKPQTWNRDFLELGYWGFFGAWSLGFGASRSARHARASSRPSKSFLLVMPMTWSRSWPFLKKRSAGIARTLYFIERLWFSSTFTFATFTDPA